MKMNRLGIVCATLIGLTAVVLEVHSQEKKESAAAHKIGISRFEVDPCHQGMRHGGCGGKSGS